LKKLNRKKEVEVKEDIENDEDDKDFLNDYDKFLIENRSSRSNDNIGIRNSNVTVQVKIRGSNKLKTNTEQDQNTTSKKFTLMTRGNNKTKTKDLEVPLDSKFATLHNQNVIKEKQENQVEEDVKKVIIQMDKLNREQQEKEKQIKLGSKPYLETKRGQNNEIYKDNKNKKNY